jgi:hypothetical protein
MLSMGFLLLGFQANREKLELFCSDGCQAGFLVRGGSQDKRPCVAVHYAVGTDSSTLFQLLLALLRQRQIIVRHRTCFLDKAVKGNEDFIAKTKQYARRTFCRQIRSYFPKAVSNWAA